MTIAAHDAPVVVTGASGFIAKYIIAELLRRGYAVRGTLRDLVKSAAVAQSHSNNWCRYRQATFASADLMRDDGWDAIMDHTHYVIHTASPFPVQQPDNPDDVIGAGA